MSYQINKEMLADPTGMRVYNFCTFVVVIVVVDSGPPFYNVGSVCSFH